MSTPAYVGEPMYQITFEGGCLPEVRYIFFLSSRPNGLSSASHPEVMA